MPALILQLSRLGFLILLWIFILAAVRVVRSDLRVASEGRAGVLAASKRQQRRNAAPARGTGRGPSMQASTLVVTAGSMAGTRLRLSSGPILIGRADDSTLVLDDDFASTRHARLIQQGDGWALEDLGSTNGTYLDRMKVTATTPVPVGVPIRIGRSVMELRP